MQLSSRQEQILKESILIIHEGGIQGLTVRKLAGRLGFSEPAVYRHFPNKHAILRGILSLFRHGMRQSLLVIQEAPTGAWEKLDRTLSNIFSRFVKNPALVTVVLAEGMFQNDRSLTEDVLGIMDELRAYFEQILKQGRKSGEIRRDIPLSQQALLVMGGMRLLVTRWRLSLQSFDLEKEGRSFSRTMQTLLKPLEKE